MHVVVGFSKKMKFSRSHLTVIRHENGAFDERSSNRSNFIIGDQGGASRDDAIFSVERHPISWVTEFDHFWNWFGKNKLQGDLQPLK